ncbi:MAG: hypothetical protein KF729_09880 [Sandaracinaceae bacterium]|nr:hypothetical protein [Sandaracinaceae bacterium]
MNTMACWVGRISDHRVARRSVALGVVAALAVVGCAKSTLRDPTDGGVGGDDGGTAPRELGPGDPRACATAPLLPNDHRLRVDPTGATPPPAGSCFRASIFGFDEYDTRYRELSYRIEVPARTGVELTVSETDRIPYLALVEGCDVAPGEERCVTYGASTLFESTPGVFFFGNPEGVTKPLVLSLRWSGLGDEAIPTPFTLETRSFSLPAEAACEAARPLAPGALLPARSERGGTYENWHCIRLPEAHFHEITIPAWHQTVALPDSQVLRQRAECGCDPRGGYTNLLDNFTDAPRTVVLERDPSQPLGVRYAPLPPNATCERASRLDVAGSEGAMRPLEVTPYARGVAEWRPDACSATNEAIWYRVTVPAGRTVRVRGRVSGSPYLALFALPGACTGEPSEGCDRGENTSIDEAFTHLHLDLANPSTEAVERVLVLGYEGPDSGPLAGTLGAHLLE